MRKIYLLLLVGFFFTVKVEAKKVKGQIIYTHDTANVVFLIPTRFFLQEPNYEKLQYKVRFIDDTGKKKVIRAGHAREIQFTFGSENIRMLSRYNSIGMGSLLSMKSDLFLKLEIDGKLKLFIYFYTQSIPGAYNSSTGAMTGGYSYPVEKYILQKENSGLKRPRGISFRKDMMEYFKDCPELVQKIENKEFRNSDLESMVIFYNSKCR